MKRLVDELIKGVWAWLSGGFLLDGEAETGHLKVSGVDVRLIRNSDLAMLIPPIDA